MGRVEAALGYVDAAEWLVTSREDTPPYGIEGWLGSVYFAIGQPERWAQLCATQLERRGDHHVNVWACRVFALTFAGAVEEAAAIVGGLIEAGEATNNPFLHSFAIGAATSFQLTTADPVRGLDACRQGLAIAHDCCNGFNESILAFLLARIEAHDAVSVPALIHLMVAVRNYHDSGNIGSLRSPLAGASTFLERLGAYEPAATIAGFAASPIALGAVPEFSTTIAHLREVLGDETYEGFARNGETMTMAEIAAYTYEQIDEARAQLERLR